MSNRSSEAPRLSDTQLAEVLALTKDADSVELKLTVPDPERRAMVQVAAELRAFLSGKGVDLSGEQQTKTKAALEYFAASLGTAAEA